MHVKSPFKRRITLKWYVGLPVHYVRVRFLEVMISHCKHQELLFSLKRSLFRSDLPAIRKLGLKTEECPVYQEI